MKRMIKGEYMDKNTVYAIEECISQILDGLCDGDGIEFLLPKFDDILILLESDKTSEDLLPY